MAEQTVDVKSPVITDRRNEAIHYLAMLVWPFGIMIDAFRHWEKPWSKNVFWLFCIFFGYTFIIAKSSSSLDSAAVARQFVNYTHANMSLGELWRTFYSESSNIVDIVQPLLFLLVSSVTDNPTILFTVFAVIFGYFYSRNLWLVLGYIKGNFNIVLFVFFLTFALTNPIWNINGFRMYAAAQIFLYGTLSYLLEGKSKKIIWSAVSVLFHYSFLLPVVILFLFTIIKNRINIYLGFFVLTAFIKELDLQMVRSFLSFLPPVFQLRVEGYTSTEYAAAISSIKQSASWFLPLSSKCIAWVTYGMSLFIYFFYRETLKERKDLITLFCFSLLLCGFANIMSLIPSGHRFLSISHSFIFPLFIIFISNTPVTRGLSIIKGISMPLLIFYCLITIRLGMEHYGLMTLFGNPIYATFSDSVPLIEGIKGLF
ncbi:MAG: EpsG family protein [Bacteroidales bacterium]|nr:EpsG family protein [Bacteroidales bacterium]